MKAYLTKNDIKKNIANLPILTFEVTAAWNFKSANIVIMRKILKINLVVKKNNG
ncbi:hypothetical protein FACS1894178_3790 [Bacteroidia bacterium]|nr:hypothetical protein FACS1894178_3790 [Bacteroidia bacterium]